MGAGPGDELTAPSLCLWATVAIKLGGAFADVCHVKTLVPSAHAGVALPHEALPPCA